MTTKKTTRSKRKKTADADSVRLRRFLYLWLPVICLALIVFYATALDPSKPTGVTAEASLVGKIKPAGAQSTSNIYTIKLGNGEETEIFIPEKKAPGPGGRIVVEEYATFIFKKKTYHYLRTLDNPKESK